MQVDELNEIFSCQAAFVKLPKYEGEFAMMRLLHELPAGECAVCREMSLKWLQRQLQLEEGQRNKERMTQEANHFRDKGNQIYTAKGATRDLLAACRLYTLAIFSAPAGSEALALAHANRAMALQEYGYYQQAYDDCECARKQGYPQRLLHKVLTRQAYCAGQLGDAERLKLHLKELDGMTLNASFTQQIQELHIKLDELQTRGTNGVEDAKGEFSLHRETQEIVSTGTAEGRYMIASQTIAEHELIFNERASSFVPVAGRLICQQCGVTQLIPFPCAHCHGRVVYCSLRCLAQHAKTHTYECAAYQRQLFSHIGIAHLAFRLVLDGLPQMLPLLRPKRNAQELWAALAKSAGDSSVKVEYARTLQMVTHLGRMKYGDIVWFALVSQLLVVYLQEFTNFFETFVDDTVTASRSDWMLITGALILRHIGQLIVNGHSCISALPQGSKTADPLLDLPLMADGLWCGPYRVRRGRLHVFSDYSEVAAANFPYLSICNHACEQSFQPRFSGRCVSTYATKRIEAGEQIYNCYTQSYRRSLREERQAILQSTYHFKCNCPKCCTAQPDEYYERFHRYRCEQSQCRQVFVPQLPQLSSLNWWTEDDGLPPREYLQCSVCGSSQNCEWLQNFNTLLKCAGHGASRQLLYESYAALDNWLLDYHEFKLHLAQQLVSKCFDAHNAGFYLMESEFTTLAHILQFCLRGIVEQGFLKDIEYATNMTYLWDFIALGKYTCERAEMRQMLEASEILSDEMKMIFMHYYTDYMEPLIV